MSEPIPYSRQCISEADIKAVSETLKSTLITTGPKVEAFESALTKISGARYAVAVANGTVALHLAVAALELDKNFIGLTSPITFAASANAFLYSGGKLRFSDISNERPLLCPDKLEKFCKEQTPPAVVIPVSFAGIPAPLPRIFELAKEYGFKVIEDAAHSIGSRYKDHGKWISSGSCTHSDLSIFSFHPVKSITCAEGGAVTTNDEKLYQRLLLLRGHGVERDKAKMQSLGKDPWEYEIQSLGYNGRLSDIHAALGLSQLSRISEFAEHKLALALRYTKAFKNIPDFNCPLITKDEDPHLHLYPICLIGPEAEEKRRALYFYLKEKDIYPQVHYTPLHYHPHFKDLEHHPKGSLPNAEAFYRGELSLPLYSGLKEYQQDRVIAAVQSFFS